MKLCETDTLCGKIKGIETENCVEYRGIKYATAKRWEYPKQVTSWEGVYDATKFSECSYQKRGFEDDAKCNAFYHKEFRKGMSFTYSEDCLFLNIWAPKDAKDCPVLIYIHGGSFTGGSANEGHVSGAAYAQNGIIFVAMNYRLGPFGFISHPDLKDENGICGNYGLYDQYTAIKWVKDNIAAFGGNGEKITLLGQSAGAMSVDIQLNNPMSSGWFSGAIMMSGAALQRAVMKPATPESSKPFWDEVIKCAKCSDIEELRAVDEKTLFYAWLEAQKNVKGAMKYTLPVYDGKLLSKGNFEMKKIPNLPYILGVTSHDMIPAGLELVARKWAKSTAKNGNDKCYVYNFVHMLPGDDFGAWHSADLLYAFGTLHKNWRPFEDVDREISKQMIASFSSFVKTQNPNCGEIPLWEAKSNMALRFGKDTKMMKWPTKMLIKNTINNKGPM